MLLQAEDCVEEILTRVGKRLVVATPLGIGKPNPILNALYRRACADKSLRLRIVTALHLERPRARGDLERRLIAPLAERLFGTYPELLYLEARRRGALPENVEISEFYLSPGRELHVAQAQQSYISCNYTDVLRDLEEAGVNVLAQMIAGPEEVDGETRYSLSGNTDLSLELLERLKAAQRPTVAVAQASSQLPFMYGQAMVPPGAFDLVLRNPELDYPPFAPPNQPVSTADYFVALHASLLVRDGGTLQLGIGSMADAVAHLLRLRHQESDSYRSLCARSGAEAYRHLIDSFGGSDPFERGLYAATEMLANGFLALYRAGILKRRVFPCAALQRLLDLGRVGETVTPDTLEALLEDGAVSSTLSENDVELLQELGILRRDLGFEAGALVLPDGRRVDAELADPYKAARVMELCLGERLRGGVLAHAGFFLGPRVFYRALAELPREERELFEMARISFVNRLYGMAGGEELKRAQRRHARFLNSVLLVTLLGAAVSDGLENGQVLSGVGGQYDFVAMSKELEDGRSVLMLRSTRLNRGTVESNLRFGYGHTTIPRHLRDLVVTEYGIADLRGKTDREVVLELVAIADRRFQDRLLQEAREAGKLRKGDRLPERCSGNRPQRLEQLLDEGRERGLFPRFPLGTDLTEEEVALSSALPELEKRFVARSASLLRPHALLSALRPPPQARRFLERMGLERPASLRERLLRRVVVFALAQDSWL